MTFTNRVKTLTQDKILPKVVDNYLVVSIENPYDPDMQTPKGTGFGLKSVRRRLYLLFGRNDLIEINQQAGSFVVIFRVPAEEKIAF
jgi:LytS/YehU family sensor histidine kinase